MADIAQEVVKTFGNQLRIRVCGICIQNNQILLVNHRGLGKSNIFWSPPGGGMHFGESATEALQREFQEETGFTAGVGKFLFINEFLDGTLHAIELFFEVRILDGKLHVGTDPELEQNNQIIKEVMFMPLEKLKVYQPEEMHSLFHKCQTLQDISQMNGYICTKRLP